MAQKVSVCVDLWSVDVDRDEFGADPLDTEGDGFLDGEFFFVWARSGILNIHSFVSWLQDGMGSLKVVAGGLQLSGQALVLDVLKASAIRSRQGQPISIGALNSNHLTDGVPI